MTATAGKPASTGDWDGGELLELANLISFKVGVWNHLEYPENVPPLGERSAEAIRAGHDVVKNIDRVTRLLYRLREQLVGELRQDEDIHAARVDAMLAESRAARADPPPSQKRKGPQVELQGGAQVSCGCSRKDGMIYHQSQTCTDPVVAQLGWYADQPAAGA